MDIFNRDLLLTYMQANKGVPDNYKIINYLYAQCLENLNEVNKTFNNALKVGYNYVDILPLITPGKIINFTQTSFAKNPLQHSTATNKALLNEETITPYTLPANNYDLIISLFNLGLVNNLQLALKHLYSLLNTGGMILLALPTVGTMQNILQALMKTDLQIFNAFYSRIHHFTSIDIVGNLLGTAKFKNIVVTNHSLQLNYNNIADLFKHLKQFNYSNIMYHKYCGLTTPNYLKTLMLNLQQIENNNQIGVTLKYCIATAFKE